MQNNMGKDEISKTSLRTDAIELVLVLWINLKPQTHCIRKHEIKKLYLTSTSWVYFIQQGSGMLTAAYHKKKHTLHV
jgi:hypothetical protein